MLLSSLTLFVLDETVKVVDWFDTLDNDDLAVSEHDSSIGIVFVIVVANNNDDLLLALIDVLSLLSIFVSDDSTELLTNSFGVKFCCSSGELSFFLKVLLVVILNLFFNFSAKYFNAHNDASLHDSIDVFPDPLNGLSDFCSIDKVT